MSEIYGGPPGGGGRVYGTVNTYGQVGGFDSEPKPYYDKQLQAWIDPDGTVRPRVKPGRHGPANHGQNAADMLVKEYLHNIKIRR